MLICFAAADEGSVKVGKRLSDIGQAKKLQFAQTRSQAIKENDSGLTLLLDKRQEQNVENSFSKKYLLEKGDKGCPKVPTATAVSTFLVSINPVTAVSNNCDCNVETASNNWMSLLKKAIKKGKTGKSNPNQTRDKSLLCLSETNALRRACLAIVEWK